MTARVLVSVESGEPIGGGVHCASCAMAFLAAALRMTFHRAGIFDSGVRTVAFKVTLRPVLMMPTVFARAVLSFTGATCKYRTCGMTTLKFTCAVVLEAELGDSDSMWDSGTAISGSSNAVALIRPLNAQCHFTMSPRCTPAIHPHRRYRQTAGVL
jgi:hypothetical protein